MVHDRNDHDRNHHEHHIGKPVSPGAQNAGHLLLVRRTAGVRSVVSEPACAVQNGGEEVHHQSENIEITQFGNIIRIEETLPRRTVHHGRSDRAVPRNVQKNVADNDHKHRIAEQPLKRIRNQQRNPAARPDTDHRHRHQEHENDCEAWNRKPENRYAVRQSEKVDEKVHRDRRPERICDHLGNRAQRGGENSERPVVTHFKELAERERLRLTPAVDAVTGQ